MRTIIIVVSIGKRDHLLRYSIPRIMKFATRHQYNFALVTEPIQPPGKPPHYAKLRAPHAFPGYDRYCIIDDDILLTAQAPPLPVVPNGFIGLARDVVQENTTNKAVQWTGNTGFLVFDKSSIPLLDQACEHGDEPTVWGYADQGALNYILWKLGKAYEIDGRWNFAPVIAHFHSNPKIGWEKWKSSRITRLSYFLKLSLLPRSSERLALAGVWGIHLIRAPYTRLYDFIAPK